jgi:hypothetical protein
MWVNPNNQDLVIVEEAGNADTPPLTWSPLSVRWRRWGDTRHRDGGTDPTELLIPARPVIYRPTRACNTELHHLTQPDMREREWDTLIHGTRAAESDSRRYWSSMG